MNDELETWTRFMAAALAAAPLAPVDTLAARADEALAEYQQRRDSGAPAAGADQPEATATPFVASVEKDSVTYEPTSAAPDDEEIDSHSDPARSARAVAHPWDLSDEQFEAIRALQRQLRHRAPGILSGEPANAQHDRDRQEHRSTVVRLTPIGHNYDAR